MELSKEEVKLLKQYQTLSNSVPSLASRLAIEIVPAIIFVSLGLYFNQIIWFLVLIGMLVFYNVQRVIRQRKSIAKLRSISQKAIGNINERSI